MKLFQNTFIVEQGSTQVVGLNPHVQWDMAPVKDKEIVYDDGFQGPCRIVAVSSYSLTSNASETSQEIARLFANYGAPLQHVSLVRRICSRNGIPGYLGSSHVVLYGHDVSEETNKGLTTYIFDFSEQRLIQVPIDRPTILTEDLELRDLIWELLEREGVTVGKLRTVFDVLVHGGNKPWNTVSKEDLDIVDQVFPNYPKSILEWIAERIRT